MRFWPPVKPRDDVARVYDAPRPAPRRHRHDVDASAVPRGAARGPEIFRARVGARISSDETLTLRVDDRPTDL